MSLIDIEVTGQDSRKIFTFTEFFHLLLHEVCTFHTGFLADMIHVQIEEKEFKTGIFAFEVSPTADTRQHRIPAFARYIGSFRQPEIAFFYQIELIGTIEDGRVFASVFTVITAYANVVITGKRFFHVFQLMKETLLRSENIEIVVLYHLGYHRIALSPTVSME